MTNSTVTESNRGDSTVKARAKASCRRHILLAVAVLSALLATFVLEGVASAETRIYTGLSFGPEGKAGSATFENVQSVATDQASGDVFVYDIGGEGSIYKFDSAGEPSDFSSTGANLIESVGGPTEEGAEQIAIAPAGSPSGTAGDIYVANNEVVKVYSPAGVELGTLGGGETCGVAVDPEGHLLIGTYEPSGGLVREYLPKSDPPENSDEIAASLQLNEICNVAADGAGNVYASNYSGEFTAKLAGIADPDPTRIKPGGVTLTTEPIGNELYLDEGDHVSVYDSAAAPAYEFGTGSLTTSHGLALDGPTDQVYLADGGSGKVMVFSPPVDVVTKGVTAPGLEAATLNGTVDPGGLQVQECVFEYGPVSEAGFGSEVPCTPTAADIQPVSSAQAVTGALTGLHPDTTYQFRLTVTIAGTATSGDVLEFSTVGPPRISEVSSVADMNSATLAATVDPRGAETSWRIESGPVGSYGDVAATGTIAPEGGPTQVSARLAGLGLATAHHWRVVAVDTEGGGETASPDQVVETLDSCGLPDGRCFELVSRADKGPLAAPGKEFQAGAQIQFQAGAAGSAFAFTVAAGYPGATAGDATLYVARRGGSGWSSEQITPPNVVEPPVESNGSNFKVLSDDLACGIVASRALLAPGVPTTVVEAGGSNLYLRDGATGAYRPITSSPPVGPITPSGGFSEYGVVGASPDCGRVTFRTEYRFPGIAAANSKFQLYEWDDGTLRNVALIPGPGGPADPTPAESIPGAMGSNPQSGSPGEEVPTDYWRSVSADGTRSIFTAVSRFGADSGHSAIFLSDAGDPAVLAGTAPAADISQSETPVDNDGNSRYWTASTDGSHVFFSARYGLAPNGSSSGATRCANTPAGGAFPGFGEGCDLYEYDDGAPAGERLTDLSPDTTDAQGAGVVGVLDASEDGSYVYFAARGRLGEAGRTEIANVAADTYNIYLAHDGGIRFVGSLGHAEAFGGNALVEGTSRATGDGTRFVFESSLGIPGSVPMVYVYSVAGGTTVCVSCRHDGRSPFSAHHLTPLIDAETTNVFDRIVRPTVLTGDGRLYFYSFDPLAPGGVEGDRNLYQWERGQVSLIATEPPGVPRNVDGTPTESFFGGASADGADIYFATPQSLTGSAQPGWNVYDARAGGGFPEPTPPAPPCDAAVEGACNSAADSPTAAATPSTSNFSGTSNPSTKKPKHHQKHKHYKRHKNGHRKAGGAGRANGNRRTGK
jgi:hypothetical protein